MFTAQCKTYGGFVIKCNVHCLWAASRNLKAHFLAIEYKRWSVVRIKEQ